MESDMDASIKQRCVIEFLAVEEIAPIEIHRRLLKVYGDDTIDVSNVRRWVRHFKGGEKGVHDKPRPGRPCTAVIPQIEERLNQLIRADRWITTRELCANLNVGCNALETMLEHFGYRKICARWVPRMLTEEQKTHHATVLPHPPYSPDLAPSDFHLFGPLKDGLRGEHFQGSDAVVKAVRKWLDSAGSDFCKRGLLALVHRWQTNGGDYVEK
ncbi:hypothetical protein J437_LFUL001458 [Ladona fulva]|uniref:Mos1 transposase HTH domain-containing protein n=1 Tax=Ladona fulva TaxID=123851 RepID=A0A8K0NRQ9_LADFU|nr:hypothetical protein J437_LFUL001458 [Ladona fulva]